MYNYAKIIKAMNGYEYNTTTPYKVLPHKGIEYNPCRDYNHISRYKGLRQVTHNVDEGDSGTDRFMSLEGPNPFQSHTEVTYFEVTTSTENRLDIIAEKTLGSATYSWVISMFNDIEDGYSCYEGQILTIPKSFTSLFNEGEILASISALKLNLGGE